MYTAQIARISSIAPIQGKDRIVQAKILNQTVIVSATMKVGDVVILFPEGGVIAQSFLQHHDLIPRKNEKGEKVGGGYFREDGRVVATKFSGVKSEAFAMPLEALVSWGKTQGIASGELASFQVGDEVSVFGEIELCRKWVNLRARPERDVSTPKEPKEKLCQLFAKHVETSHLRPNLHRLEAGDVLDVSVKMEGTSGRSTKQVSQLQGIRGWFLKFCFFFLQLFFRPISKKLGWTISTETTKTFCGSRNVQLARNTSGYHGSNDFRWKHHDQIEPFLVTGMTVFYEIVGYNGDTPIQPRHNPSVTKDKAYIKRWGSEPFVYHYGCKPGESKIFVYRINLMNEFGEVYLEYTPDQIVDWCERAGVEAVPSFKSLDVSRNDDEGCFVRVDGVEHLLTSYLDKLFADYQEEQPHPQEGLIVRVMGPDWLAFKEKDLYYKWMNGNLRPGEDIDTEEEAAQMGDT